MYTFLRIFFANRASLVYGTELYDNHVSELPKRQRCAAFRVGVLMCRDGVLMCRDGVTGASAYHKNPKYCLRQNFGICRVGVSLCRVGLTRHIRRFGVSIGL